MYKLVFYVPVDDLEKVKSAVFSTCADKIGEYDQCCWQVMGQGQFRPLEDSQPSIGKRHQLTKVDEYRVELVCANELVSAAIAALKKSHPYEEPAYDVWRLEII